MRFLPRPRSSPRDVSPGARSLAGVTDAARAVTLTRRRVRAFNPPCRRGGQRGDEDGSVGSDKADRSHQGHVHGRRWYVPCPLGCAAKMVRKCERCSDRPPRAVPQTSSTPEASRWRRRSYDDAMLTRELVDTMTTSADTTKTHHTRVIYHAARRERVKTPSLTM